MKQQKWMKEHWDGLVGVFILICLLGSLVINLLTEIKRNTYDVLDATPLAIFVLFLVFMSWSLWSNK